MLHCSFHHLTIMLHNVCALVFMSLLPVYFDQQKFDVDQKVALDEYLMSALMSMLVPHTHSLADEVCKPVKFHFICY